MHITNLVCIFHCRSVTSTYWHSDRSGRSGCFHSGGMALLSSYINIFFHKKAAFPIGNKPPWSCSKTNFCSALLSISSLVQKGQNLTRCSASLYFPYIISIMGYVLRTALSFSPCVLCTTLSQRDYREGWPLLTVETEVNGTQRVQLKRALPWLAHWACRAGTRDFAQP